MQHHPVGVDLNADFARTGDAWRTGGKARFLFTLRRMLDHTAIRGSSSLPLGPAPLRGTSLYYLHMHIVVCYMICCGVT